MLVAGGGRVAASKIEALLDGGARVHVVAVEISDALLVLVPRLDRIERRRAVPEDVKGCALVIAATDDREANRALADAAKADGILVNAVDDPEACTFYAPAVVRRGDTTIAIGTEGRSPLFAAQLRRLIDAFLPKELDAIGDLFGRIRASGLKGLKSKGAILKALADPMVSALVDAGRNEEALDRVGEIARASEQESFAAGTVAICGAGPGSKELLTLRALDRIQKADVILHDALVEPEVLALALPGTRIINVGRRASHEDKNNSQQVTIALMIREAKSNQRVLRLHAGDAFVFGRGGEEGDALDAAGVTWEIVPGVSSAIAAPASAKIPLTHRGEARGFSVRTGHTLSGYSNVDLPRSEETLVILMGLGAARQIMEGLIAEGYPPDLPAAAVSNATRANQRVVRATIATLAEQIEEQKLEAPATLIVGKVVHRAKADMSLGSDEAAA